MSDFKAKMHQIRFRLGLRPRPRWGSLQRSPDPLAGFKGPTSKGRRERGRKAGKKGAEGKGRKQKGKGGRNGEREGGEEEEKGKGKEEGDGRGTREGKGAPF